MIEFYNPSLEDILSADLLDFDEENPAGDDEYDEKVQRMRKEVLEFEMKYPQFKAHCEWCCGTFSLYNSSHEIEATEVNYNRFIERLRKRGWIVLPGQWDETREEELVKSHCFHGICYESLLELDRAADDLLA